MTSVDTSTAPSRQTRSSQAVRILLLATVALVVATTVARESARPEPRNLILISLDTLRADHLSTHGYARRTSPRIDRFARGSAFFRNAIAQANSTRPSHAALFTGRDPSAVLTPWSSVTTDAETLAERLRAHGFATWGFVDGGNMSSKFGFDHGFDHYEDERVGIAVQVDRARRWLSRHPAEPFFLLLHCYDIHTPYAAPAPYVKLFGDPDYRGGFRPNERYFRAVESGAEPMSERDRQETIARYDAGIRYTDEHLGTFLDWLAVKGLLETSVVVITSDHGEEFLEHGKLGHDQLYLRPNVHVPLLIRVPGERPRVIDETVELVDVLPTVLELLDLPPSEVATGTSLVPLLRGERPSVARRVAYAEKAGPEGLRTAIEGRHQLVLDPATGESRLYEFGATAAEKRDVTELEPEVATRLRAEIDRRVARAARKPDAEADEAAIEIDARTRRELEVLGYILPSEE